MNRLRLLSLLAAAALAACSKPFPELPLAAGDQAFVQTARGEADPDTRVALGALYFMHNRIDDADAVLAPVVAANPHHPQALAWYGANNCKLAGRRGPWLMGFDKLWLVHRCLGQVDSALALAPEDFTVQMVQMETGHEVDLFGSLARAQRTREKVEQMLARTPGALPPEALAQFRQTASRLDAKLGRGEKLAQQQH